MLQCTCKASGKIITISELPPMTTDTGASSTIGVSVSATGTPVTGVPATGAPAPATGAPATGAPATGVPGTGAPATGVPATGAPATTGTGDTGVYEDMLPMISISTNDFKNPNDYNDDDYPGTTLACTFCIHVPYKLFSTLTDPLYYDLALNSVENSVEVLKSEITPSGGKKHQSITIYIEVHPRTSATHGAVWKLHCTCRRKQHF